MSSSSFPSTPPRAPNRPHPGQPAAAPPPGGADTTAHRSASPPDTVPPSSLGVTSPRLLALDAARVLATFGVMWTHVAEVQGHGGAWAALGRFGTSFHILAAVFLST